jgi:hypothetical protein
VAARAAQCSSVDQLIIYENKQNLFYCVIVQNALKMLFFLEVFFVYIQTIITIENHGDFTIFLIN